MSIPLEATLFRCYSVDINFFNLPSNQFFQYDASNGINLVLNFIFRVPQEEFHA
jgi:hypothetical protein